METTWKQLRIDVLKRKYEQYLEEYSIHHDDRKCLCNLYHRLMTALASLPDEPNNYVCHAINKCFYEDMATMDQIVNWFRYGIPHASRIMDDVRTSAEGISRAYRYFDLNKRAYCNYLREDLMETYHLSKYNAGRLVREVIRVRKEIA